MAKKSVNFDIDLKIWSLKCQITNMGLAAAKWPPKSTTLPATRLPFTPPIASFVIALI
jgi:hypothetical protein